MVNHQVDARLILPMLVHAGCSDCTNSDRWISYPSSLLLEALAGFDPGTRWQANIAVAYGARQEVARPDKKR